MKKAIIILIFLCANIGLFAQAYLSKFPIAISYYGHYGYQPGLKIGTTYAFKEWRNKDRSNSPIQQLTINPQIGFFFYPQTSTNLVLNTEFGYYRKPVINNRYFILSVGLGYMAESQLLSIAMNIGNGSTTEKERELLHYFMPTINYEFGKEFKKIDANWFAKLSAGTKLSTQHESNAVVFTEFGIRWYL